jgi:hypothetical protein
MQFLTPEECSKWSGSRWQNEAGRSNSRLQIPYANHPPRVHHIARWLARTLSFDGPALLWVTNPDVGQTNWHLYYRLRESYGDHRSVDHAPGHLCLNYECEDMATLLYLTMLYGWDATLIFESSYVTLTFSHHRFLDAISDDDAIVEDIRQNASEIATTRS